MGKSGGRWKADTMSCVERRLSIIIIIIIIMLLLLPLRTVAAGGLVLGMPPTDSSRAGIVYRPDSRDPAEIRESGGFWPRDMTPGNFLQLSQNTSLFRHVNMAAHRWTRHADSGYVSTTRSLDAAAEILRRSGLMPGGFIYEIRPTPNFIDVRGSLGDFHQGLEDDDEVAALGGIQFHQILAWRQVAQAPGRRGYYNAQRTANDQYRPALFDGTSDGGVKPLLAGFPTDHLVFQEKLEPWCGAPLGKPAENRHCVLAGETPLQSATKHMALLMTVSRLRIRARVSTRSWAGAAHSLSITVGDSKAIMLFRDPFPGKAVDVSVNLKEAFGLRDVLVDDLTNVGLVVMPVPHPVATKAISIQGFSLTINTTIFGTALEMDKFTELNREFDTETVVVPTKVWGAAVSPEDWEAVEL
ncbi:putative heat-labile enterotoxin [Ophiocordyceps polyrhachis-furcata BCC 54312]|uniref:Heat-labile enterotoxin n=1 Tax=Ophiocordyceps polyrhachis-furcata BCC 54312 TaxID=1330021 RepID=A0A367LP48_9HYPO|nr:putative heat-labile enterotoxin [Ophiocordyceps polyrhachis-furcata BCC 54312]